MREDLNNWAQGNKGLVGLFANQTLHHPTSSQNSASSQATTLGHQHSSHQQQQQQPQQQHHHQQPQHYFNAISSPNQLLLNQMSSPNLNQLNNSSDNQQQQLQQLQHYFNATPVSSLQHQLLINQMSSQNLNKLNGGSGQQAQAPLHLQQQQSFNLHQQQQQQAPTYNMNSSDYSSSTYHVYDQILGDQIIDDLIVIKQERMKKKLEQEHRRKVILFSLAVILLVGLLMFLIVQLFKATAPQQATFSSQATQQQINSISLPRIEHNNNNDLHRQFNDNYRDSMRTHWAPPSGGPSDDKQWEYPNKFIPRPPVLIPNPVISNPRQPPQQQQPLPLPLPPPPPQLQPQPQPQPPQQQQPQQQQQPFVPAVLTQAFLPQQPLPLPSSSTTQQPPLVVVSQQSPTQTQPQTTPQPAGQTRPSISSDNSANNNVRGCHGRHCSPASGCPNQCSGRGQCVKVTPPSLGQQDSTSWLVQHQSQQPEWRCQCPPGSTGDDCGILIERQCDDGIDNDKGKCRRPSRISFEGRRQGSMRICSPIGPERVSAYPRTPLTSQPLSTSSLEYHHIQMD
jgi:hypothetical protein